ncbi:MAG TPA: hypothetical protein GXZ85_03135 [Firmicutes bacterium]|nr:hypothetical protein [Bacillota bacterium]
MKKKSFALTMVLVILMFALPIGCSAGPDDIPLPPCTGMSVPAPGDVVPFPYVTM